MRALGPMILSCVMVLAEPGEFAVAQTIPTPTIVSRAEYVGALSNQHADFLATYYIESTVRGTEVRVPLVAGNVGLTETTASTNKIRIKREGRALYAVVPRGRHRVKIAFSAALENTGDLWKSVSFSPGAALIRKIDVSAGGEDAKVEFHAATPVRSEHAKGKTRVIGYMGTETRLRVRWQAKAKEVKVKPVVICNVHQLMQVSTTAVKLHARLVYDIPRGSVSSFLVHAPTSAAIVSVSGEQLRDWTIDKDAGTQSCAVELLKPVSGRYTLEVLAEQAVGDLPHAVTAPRIAAGRVARQEGTLVIVPDEVLLKVTSSEGLNRINSPTAVDAAGWKPSRVAAAHSSYRFPKPEYDCRFTVHAIQADLFASSTIAATVDSNRTRIRDRMKLEVRKTGVFTVSFIPPPETSVVDVKGDLVDNWKVCDVAGGQQLDVLFKRKVLGETSLRLMTERAYEALPDTLALAGLRLVNAQAQSGAIGIAPADGIALRERRAAQLRTLPVDSLDTQAANALLGYSFRKPGWELELQLESLRPTVSCDIFNLVTLGDGFLGGSATLNYAIENAGVQELELQVPATWQNVDIIGQDIKRRKLEKGTCRILLQDRIRGAYPLVITYDQPFDPSADVIPIAGIRTKGAARETGYIAVASGAGLQVSESGRSPTLRPIDSSELPDKYQALIENTVMKTYSYAHQPYDLRLKAIRRKQQQMLDAVADHVKLMTVVAPGGRRETQATYLVNNSRKDALRVKLPNDAKLWSVFVDSKATRPEMDDGTLVIPLSDSCRAGRAVPVEFTYVEHGEPVRGFPRTGLSLAGPVVDLPASYVQWELYLPQWIHAGRFGGTMSSERGYEYTISAQLDLASANIQRICHSYCRGFVLVLAALLFVGLIVAGIKAGGGETVLTAFIVVAIGLVLFAIAMPSFVKARNTSQQNACINNLRQIDSGKEQCALAMKWGDTDEVDTRLVNAYIKGNTTPECPSGGRYVYGRMDQNPVCTCAGHRLKGTQWSAPAIAEAEARMVAATRRKVSQVRKAGAMSVGLLPVRVVVPKEGRVWLFSKVLHTDERPVRIEARLLSLNAAHALGLFCSAVLLAGGILVGWRGKSHSSLAWTTMSAVSLFMSVAVFFFAQQIVYYFIMALPTVLVALSAVAIWRFGPVPETTGRHRSTPPPVPPQPFDDGDDGPAGTGGSGAAAAFCTLALVVGTLCGLPAIAEAGHPGPRALDVEVRRAEYSGAVTGGVARFRTELEVEARPSALPGGGRSRHHGPARVFLFGPGIAVRDLSVKGDGAQYAQDRDGLVLHLSEPGMFEVVVDFVAPVQGDAAHKWVTETLPTSISTIIECSIDEPNVTVTSSSAVSVRTSYEPKHTKVEMVLGPAPRLDMRWAPRARRYEKSQVTAFCRSATRVHVSEGALELRSALRYRVTQGRMLEARVSLPEGLRLLKVSGPKVRTWELKTEGKQNELVIETKSAMTPDDVLEIHAEITCGQFPCTVAVPVPVPTGVHRTGGLLVIDAAEGIEAGAHTHAGLQQVDTDEFPARLLPAGPHSRTLQAFRFWKPHFDLRLTVNRVQPDVRATVTQTLTVGDTDLLLNTGLEYDIRRAGVFGLKVALPEGYEVDSVDGKGIENWTEPGDEGVLRVEFAGKVKGNYALSLELHRPAKPAEGIVLTPVVPVGVSDCKGFVAIGAVFGMTVSGHEARGLTSMPVKELPAARKDTRLAFSFRKPDWTLSVLTERSPSWVQAEGTHVVNVSEGRMRVMSDFTYSIQNAPTDRFEFLFPTNAQNIQITGEGIREKGDVPGGKGILLQSKISGSYRMAATFDIPLPPRAEQAVLQLARTRGPEREQGIVLISGLLPVHVTELKRSAQALLRLNVPDLPAEVRRRAEGQSRLAYRYLRRDQQLHIGLRRYRPVEMLTASVEKAVLTSVLAEDGQMMTLATYKIRNTGQQYVRIALPEGSRLWSCRVANEAARTVAEGTDVLVPIVPTSEEEPACRVRINYVSSLPSLREEKKLRLTAPVLDLPVQNTVWEVYLPKGYNYRNFDGSARHRDDVEPVFREFGLSEYRGSLITKGLARQMKARDLISRAKKMVKKGNIKGARRQYRQAKQADARNHDVDLGLQALSQIEAHANVLLSAAGPGDIDFNAAVQKASQMAHVRDADRRRRLVMAQRQAERVRKVHAVPAAKTTQLQINLPIEGFRYVFEQILWVPRDEPVSVDAEVTLQRGKGGLRSLALVLLGSVFAALFVGGCMARSRLQVFVATVLLGMLYIYIVLM